MGGVGPPTFHTGCILSAQVDGITNLDLPAVLVTFNNTISPNVSLSGTNLSITVPSLSLPDGSAVTINVLIYGRSLNPGGPFTWDSTQAC